ncbi:MULTISPECIES: right-handed parallel beta-helix repeat-containing protein [unclassified Chryseobacterium]|uniref:right-handed parallel beta-helix repeat-containing protein n=1 Tax=unclassified Chryseobacterium TaxID=2593645 RepID=UPI000F45DB13|nr:right-handed parallel beta-helix repeat-containing protein [Chryseobacterium sp. G0240]ROI01346.1 hypothetical protein EGI16_17645 [Chryseobacterium sp. G0240]
MIYTEDFFAPGSTYPNDNLVQLVDSFTNENINFIKTITWLDGTSMTDSHVDGIIYRKKGADYYVHSSVPAGTSLSAGTFGVKADGQTDDSDALQKAFSFCGKNGWKLTLPIGEIVISQKIECDMRNANNSRRFQLIGAGINLTVFKCIGSSMTGGLYFLSDQNNPLYLTLSGFSMRRPDVPAASGGIGIYVEKLMGIAIRDVEVFKFNTGIQVMDTCSSLFENVKTHWGGTGFYAEMQTITNPNALTFVNCGFNSNAVKGVVLRSIHNVKFDGCAFEGNYGNALEASYNASNGRVGLNLVNNYFEGTSNGVDVYYAINAGGTANFIGNTFNRLTDSIYTSIYAISNTTEKSYLNFMGNGFLNAGDFVPAADKPAVLLSGNMANTHYTDSNYYETATDVLVSI